MHGGVSKRELVSHCVSGRSLSERQTSILTDISSGLKDLTRGVFVPDRKSRLYDLLGETDGHRLMSYLTDGPRPSRD